MNKTRIYFGVSLLILAISFNAKAQTCTPSPDCNSLGYTKKADDCGESVKCPFDTNKVFCLKDFPCEIGSILYSDKSCSKTVKAGKTAIGVVFDMNKRLAVALDFTNMLQWSPDGKYQDINELRSCMRCSDINSCTKSGKDNTSKIVSEYGSGANYAAGYCANYTTEGTAKGDWFLPNILELQLLHNAYDDINKSLELLNKPRFGWAHWSSDTRNRNYSWCFVISQGSNSNECDKSEYYYVAPITFF